MKIGIIAEEDNDVEVLYELTCKITAENTFSFKKFLGHGCGPIQKKCAAWAENLMRRGCTLLVVIHDLDDRNKATLFSDLNRQVQSVTFEAHLILIPVLELESWLLTDGQALKNIFKMSKTPNLPGQPETIMDPKKHLKDIVWKMAKKRYINTIHNKKIAKEITLPALNKCPSFQPYPAFISTHLTG